jgi:RNA recognition motif-containing protein|eukprot:CAMPEP_0174293946 /NCGR_PEP_ID=MMETSP0809-20121228/40186_1 /TAXON_ID=73025 ORGANISM="Eutreptiella gymnastica-like, Strain CCMP1594" /NCGR_SAMPLE_ID=MMETSP0809 /ASSEMBLY_ACC=CAM_ASM_000658 /LENGTH=355 /DNA_ID=CAMNT_0015395069 /DNA_START=29 /DNA_END=1096 /DNA_ORIENTATION=+
MFPTQGKYFIGGLSRETTSESLKAYFELFGELSDAVVMMKDNRSRGFGFVTFAQPEAVPPNFVTSMHLVDGKQVDVKAAIPEEELQTSTGVKKLFIGGLTATTTKEHLEQHFGQFGTLTDAVVMETNGRPRGFGFVTFETEDQAESAFRFAPGHQLDGKTVDVKKAEPKGSPNLTQPFTGGFAPLGGYPGYVGFGGPMQPMRGMGLPARNAPSVPMRAARPYGGGKPMMQQLTPNKPSGMYGNTENPHSIGAKTFVGGLAHHSNEDSLVSYFSAYGNIVGCEVMRRDGVSRGFGFVVFSHDSEAALAMSQVNHVIDGKQVECKACRPKTPEPPQKQGFLPYSTWPQFPAHPGIFA